MQNIVIFGITGAIGNAVLTKLSKTYPNANIYGISQKPPASKLANINYLQSNYSDEKNIEALADNFDENLDLVFVTTGILHTDTISPEKSLKQISTTNFEQIFAANTIFPALIAKYFTPKLNKASKSVFASISARVGSISDNRLGGWYAYRMSKAALNMFTKTASIELARTNKNVIIITLHPGTVDSGLSKPFQANVPDGKLFTPTYSASKLIEVIESLKLEDSGKCFDWDNKEIQP
ncbi:SDR family NAD(P)-dependent oxidoreductase [Francisella sp. Scap27]|uniref:SDR family NAD(P)-dependent oxidoreductase n=1 Tax=Francisella sp. Scap27 TaxID=2589986 RepID=UPI0015BFA47B|nr:SDR family NAD(P)-dependent oxidoreductase [Francisella sp. Scap27]QLE78976.1 SDR family NAD(P)-dependent oxidoreductase [Francisella sp. Scap27]